MKMNQDYQEFNAIRLGRKKDRGKRGSGIIGHTPTMLRSIITEKTETRNTYFQGENIRESQVSVIQAMLGLEVKQR